jgi:hypothetical protein
MTHRVHLIAGLIATLLIKETGHLNADREYPISRNQGIAEPGP